MISLHILDIKNFMAQLLLRDSFDRFYLTEATINTFASFYMDGHLQKDYYTSEELETTVEYRQPYALWKQMRPFCLDLIKGKKTPLSFKIIFQLSDADTGRLLARAGVPFSPGDVGGLYLNLHYDGRALHCVTGTALKFFTMDKSLEIAWDETVRKFFRQKDISVE